MLRPKGNSLILMLLIISLMGICVLSSFRHIRNSVATVNGEILARTAREEAVQSSLQKKASLLQVPSRRFVCDERKSSRGSIEISRSLCALHFPSSFSFMSQNILDASVHGTDKIPGFDYAKLFQNPSPCDVHDFPWNGHSPSGFKLSPAAVVSAKTCSISTLKETAGLVLHSNLFLHKPFRILNPQNTDNFTTLAAKGFIDLNTNVQLESDTLLVAGGDFHIKTLHAMPGANLRATVISATGAVQIEEIGNGISLKVVAKEGIRLPRNYNSSARHLLLPPLIQVLPLALQGGSSSQS